VIRGGDDHAIGAARGRRVPREESPAGGESRGRRVSRGEHLQERAGCGGGLERLRDGRSNAPFLEGRSPSTPEIKEERERVEKLKGKNICIQ
jgi:hypothetical protein